LARLLLLGVVMTSKLPVRGWLIAAAIMVAATLPGCVADDGTAANDAVGETSDALTAAARHKRAQDMFAKPVIARMWMPGHKTVGDRTAAEVARALLRGGKPSMVSGLIRLDAGADLDAQEPAFADYRAVRQGMSGVPFDIVLNACQYKTADALTGHLAAINGKLGGQKPEAWFFDFYDTPLHDRKGDCDARSPHADAMLRTVAEWAHRQNQLIGGNVWSGSGLPPGADFYAVPDEHGKNATFDLVAKLPKDVVRLVHVENNPQNCWVKQGDASTLDDPRHPTKDTCKGSGGDEYIWRMTPNERQTYDDDFAAAGRRDDYAYMRPVFFPLSDHLAVGGSQSFDRDANLAASKLPYVAGP
jgi:hypothetical protein